MNASHQPLLTRMRKLAWYERFSSASWMATPWQRLALLALIGIGPGLALWASWHQTEHALSAQSGNLEYTMAQGQNRSLNESLYLPVLMGVGLEVGGQSPPPLPASPTPSPSPTAAATLNPTATPPPTATPSDGGQRVFEGVTDQGQPVRVEALSDLSAVVVFEIDAQVTCPTNTGTVEVRIADTLGYRTVNNTFQIRYPSAGGKEHIFRGTFDNSGSRITDGQWFIWLDNESNEQPCSEKGTWNANFLP